MPFRKGEDNNGIARIVSYLIQFNTIRTWRLQRDNDQTVAMGMDGGTERERGIDSKGLQMVIGSDSY